MRNVSCSALHFPSKLKNILKIFFKLPYKMPSSVGDALTSELNYNNIQYHKYQHKVLLHKHITNIYENVTNNIPKVHNHLIK